MNKSLKILIGIALIVRIILLIVLNDKLQMNPDEERNYKIATNHINGYGYSMYDQYKQQYYQTAFHASFPVFIYEFLINHNIKKETWILFNLFCYVVLFGFSISCFYRLSAFFLINAKYCLLATATYCFYPSVMLYIGSFILYENIVLPLLVIVVYKLLRIIHHKITTSDYFVIPVSICISCLLRPNSIAVYAVLFSVYFFILLSKRKTTPVWILSIAVISTTLLHIPILLKNKKMFGSYVLSTEGGFTWLLGHNPTARGGWAGNWQEPASPYFKYVHSQIANLDSLNEYQQSEQSKALAFKWIAANPVNELKLSIRKLGIWLYPANFSNLKTWDWFNPFNFAVHIFFLMALGKMVLKRKLSFDELIILAPIIASIALSLLFYTGYRWRFYAEPFMIIFAWSFFASPKYVKKKQVMDA